MNNVYKITYEKEKNKIQLRKEQLNWVRERNNCKRDSDCIENSYGQRIQVLIDKYVDEQAVPDEYIFDLFKKYPLKDCSAINPKTPYKITKEYIGSVKEKCEKIKDVIWNEKSILKLKIQKPIIKAKFFKDKKYRDFIRKSIKKVNLPIKKSNFFPASVFYGEDLMVLNHDDTTRLDTLAWDGLIKTDMCDLRIYKGEFDNNLENGEEYLSFAGANFTIVYYKDPQRHPGNEALVTLFNLNDKSLKLQEHFIGSATTNCLGYKESKHLSNLDKIKPSNYLSNILVYDDYKILFWTEYLDTQTLELEIVDGKDSTRRISINKRGEIQ